MDPKQAGTCCAKGCAVCGSETGLDSADIAKIDGYVRDRKTLTEQYSKRSKIPEAFAALSKETYADGALDRKTKELMATCVSIIVKCKPCVEHHVGEALLHGATEKEIIETMDVAVSLGGGQALVFSRFALKAMDYHRNGLGTEEGK